MAHKADRKEQSRTKILQSAGRGFRRHGFGGLGVDGLARDAGVTSGAFYAHFKSKSQAFREAVGAGLGDLKLGIETLQRERGSRWRDALIDFYVGERRTCSLTESCALQSLSSDVARADDETRQVYEQQLRLILDTMVGDAQSKVEREEAVALLALLAGGVTLARAVRDPALSEQIGAAVRKAALALNTKRARVRRRARKS